MQANNITDCVNLIINFVIIQQLLDSGVINDIIAIIEIDRSVTWYLYDFDSGALENIDPLMHTCPIKLQVHK